MGNFVIGRKSERRGNVASDSHAKRPIVVERRKEKGRKKTPRLTKTYDVKIIPATVGVVAETEEPPKKRVAAYCRVSTDQEAQETSLEEQMAHFNTVIAEHPDWELAGIYADEGISGTQVKHRVQFQQMIEDAKAKKIDLILTKSISRFARNVVDCLTNIRLLRNLRPPVSVYFDKERLDSLDEKAEVFLTMLASFAQEESRSISTNIKWATRSRMKAGTQKISTTSLLGYDTDDDGEMVIVTNEAEIVRTIYMSFDKGMHPAEIAEKLNALEIRTIKNKKPSRSSVAQNHINRFNSILQKSETTHHSSATINISIKLSPTLRSAFGQSRRPGGAPGPGRSED